MKETDREAFIRYISSKVYYVGVDCLAICNYRYWTKGGVPFCELFRKDVLHEQRCHMCRRAFGIEESKLPTKRIRETNK